MPFNALQCQCPSMPFDALRCPSMPFNAIRCLSMPLSPLERRGPARFSVLVSALNALQCASMRLNALECARAESNQCA
ncbi:hypothetical protein C2U69_32010 [Cupriavidus pinatubonensis]|nr:hypothetical protein C2U69_32010 [Cupriavidus pinatubonensis]